MKTNTTEDTLYALEQQLARSTKRTDESFLETVLADNFTEFGASGRIFSKTDIIALLASESSFTEYDLENFTLRPLSDDTIHVSRLVPWQTALHVLALSEVPYGHASAVTGNLCFIKAPFAHKKSPANEPGFSETF